MRILVAGATGSIGIHVVNTAIAMGHQPVTLVRNRRKIKLLPRGTDIFYGDVSIPETLTDLPKDIDAIIFTLGSDGQGRIGARAIDYGGVRNILRIFMDTPVRIALMTTIGVTERLSSWNQRTEVHDWKRRSERLVRASGHIYTIVRPGWFDYNNDDEHRIVMLQGDRRHAGTPEDGVISREQIAQVLVTALSNDAAKNKTFELVTERGEAQQDLTPLFAELRNDNPQKNDGVFEIGEQSTVVKLSSMIISCIWLSTTLTIRKRRRCLRRRTASASASIRPFCRSFIRLRSVKSYIQTWKACKWIWTSGCGITIMSELIREKCAVGVRQWKRYLMENASGPRKI